MSLTPGIRLGVYEVTAKIGDGGMGEVYQVRDTKLDREVVSGSRTGQFCRAGYLRCSARSFGGVSSSSYNSESTTWRTFGLPSTACSISTRLRRRSRMRGGKPMS